MFDNGNGSSPRSANLSLSDDCDISTTTAATSSIEPSVTSMTSLTSIAITETGMTSLTSINLLKKKYK